MSSLDVQPLEIPEVLLVRPRTFADPRGSFRETYNAAAYAAAGIGNAFVQDNEACSLRAGTLRGLHFQAPPHAQAKLVHVVRGRVLDVAVDIRRASPTYGRWCSTVLTADAAEQIFIPAGFAHGYCTLEADTLVAYKVDGNYAPGTEGGIRWDDPDLAIAWPELDILTAEKDRRWPTLADLRSPF